MYVKVRVFQKDCEPAKGHYYARPHGQSQAAEIFPGMHGVGSLWVCGPMWMRAHITSEEESARGSCPGIFIETKQRSRKPFFI